MDTKERFCRECGVHLVESPSSIINGGENTEMIFAPLVNTSMINNLDIGECIIIRPKHNVMLSKMERYYLISELQCNYAVADDYVPSVNIYDRKYSYSNKEST